jgi:hypothetical protein
MSTDKAQREYLAALEIKNANLEAESTQLREQLRQLAVGPRAAVETYTGTMKNYEVAKCFVFNAQAYLKSGDVETVRVNLEYLDQLLEDPMAENTEHGWEDFK